MRDFEMPWVLFFVVSEGVCVVGYYGVRTDQSDLFEITLMPASVPSDRFDHRLHVVALQAVTFRKTKPWLRSCYFFSLSDDRKGC